MPSSGQAADFRSGGLSARSQSGRRPRLVCRCCADLHMHENVLCMHVHSPKRRQRRLLASTGQSQLASTTHATRHSTCIAHSALDGYRWLHAFVTETLQTRCARPHVCARVHNFWLCVPRAKKFSLSITDARSLTWRASGCTLTSRRIAQVGLHAGLIVRWNTKEVLGTHIAWPPHLHLCSKHAVDVHCV